MSQKEKKKGETRKKMEIPMSKKTNEPPMRAPTRGTSSSPTPLLLQEAYQIRKGDFFLWLPGLGRNK
jgi:hypothetical protein